ncbi:hypothetical protein OKW76_03855 [Sphingomonas sp. S1-29]|uniref:hypothetical protein n=1 Tax=Sphingomonas sp. S1-29 TaxID=2991074 RepID=UPI0022405362|nr:hypothetical protein [Sphingomonas sp. S1-29]UZK70198.1 hypothetical protein OKW76_03855 [Sphingomonas sp. S1-29]
MDDINRDAFLPPLPRVLEPDAHGQAALLLVESMLHALVEARVFTLGTALEVIQTTCEVKMEVAQLAGESKARMLESLDLLNAIYVSFAADAE